MNTDRLSTLSLAPDQLSAVMQAGLVFVQAADETALLDSIIPQLAPHLPFDNLCLFHLPRPGSNYLVLYDASGYVGDELRNQRYRLSITGDTVVGAAARDEAPKLTRGYETHGMHFSHALLDDVATELAYPLQDETDPIGVLTAQTVVPLSPDSPEVDLFNVAAGYINSALRSLRRLQRETAKTDRMVLAQQFAVRLAENPAATPQVLALVASEGKRILGADGAGIWLPRGRRVLELAHTDNVAIQNKGDMLRTDQGLPGLVYASGWPEVVNDYRDWAIRQRVDGARRTVYAALAVPLLWQGDTSGVLVFTFTRPGYRFTDPDLQLAQLLATHAAAAIENARLLEESRNRVNELFMLNHLSETIAAQNEPEGLFQVVHRELTRSFNVNNIYVALFDEDRNLIEIPYMVEEGKTLTVDPFPLGPGLVSHIIRTRQPLRLVHDLIHQAEALGAMIVGTSELPRSFLGSPILIRDRVVGAIGLQDFNREDAFTDADESLLTTIARQVGLAIQNTSLLNQTNRRAARLQAIAEIGQVMATVDSEAELLPRAVDLIQQRFGLYYAGIFLVDDAREWAVLRAGTGEPGRRQIARSHRLQVGGNSMIGQAVNTGTARIALDVGQEAIRFDNPDLPETRTELALPLRAQQMIVGALTIQSRQVLAFTEEDISVFQVLADQLAISIESVRLFTEVRTRSEALAALNRVSDIAIASTSPAALLNAAANEIQRAFRAVNVGIALLEESEQGQVLRLVADAPGQLDPNGEPILIPVAGNTTTEQVIKTRQLMYVEDAQNNPLTGPIHSLMRARGVGSLVIAPLVTVERVMGTLGIDMAVEYDAFSEDDLGQIDAMVAQVSIALQNLALLTETTERARYLESITAISQATTTLLDPQALVQTAVNLIRDQFDLYYAGLFLADDNNEWAVLHAGTGDAGQRQIARSHRLAIDGPSMIGQAMGKAQAQIALDAPGETLRYRNPDLPDTRSELALPLRVRGQVIGALTIQSERMQAFSMADIETFQLLADQIGAAVDNARLFESEQARRESAAALLNIVQVAASTLDLGQVLKRLTQLTAQAVQADRCMVFLEDATGHLVPSMAQFADGRADREMWERFRDENTAELMSEPAVRQVLQSRQPRIIRDASNSTEIAPRWTQPGHTETLLIVPLIARDQIIGLLTLDNQTARDFTPDQVGLATTISGQVAIAIDNARLFQQTQQALSESQALLDVSRQIGSLDLNELLRNILRNTIDVIRGAATGFVLLHEPRRNHLYMGEAVGLIGSVERASMRLMPFDSPVGRVFLREAPQVFNGDGIASSITPNPEMAATFKDLTTRSDPQSLLVVPIQRGNVVTGLLVLGNHAQPFSFDQSDIQLAESLASQIAVAIENARLFQETQRLALRQRQINEIADKIRRAPNTDGIIETTIGELQRVLNARRARARLLSPDTRPKADDDE